MSELDLEYSGVDSLDYKNSGQAFFQSIVGDDDDDLLIDDPMSMYGNNFIENDNSILPVDTDEVEFINDTSWVSDKTNGALPSFTNIELGEYSLGVDKHIGNTLD